MSSQREVLIANENIVINSLYKYFVISEAATSRYNPKKKRGGRSLESLHSANIAWFVREGVASAIFLDCIITTVSVRESE